QVCAETMCVAECGDARRSVTDSTGESDLGVLLADSEGAKVRLLIENKVNAMLQPRQAERYRERGSACLASGGCSRYLTAIVAPERYFGSGDGAKGFGGKVSYEAIVDWYVA